MGAYHTGGTRGLCDQVGLTESVGTSASQEHPGTPTKRPTRSRRQEPRQAPPGQEPGGGPSGATLESITINRAPVLTLWVAVVAEAQDYSADEALSFGRYVAGMLAQYKGRALGIFEPTERSSEERAERRRTEERTGVQRAEVFGMRLPCLHIGGRRLAYSRGKAVDPEPVRAYLQRAFGGAVPLAAATAAMRELAAALPPEELPGEAYSMYEAFRPAWAGWGVPGELSLPGIRRLAAERRARAARRRLSGRGAGAAAAGLGLASSCLPTELL